jgi:hypothetical protein
MSPRSGWRCITKGRREPRGGTSHQNRQFSDASGYSWCERAGVNQPLPAEDIGMVRRILALGVLCGSLACAQPASAQGLWFGGMGFGGPGFYGPAFLGTGFGTGFSPYGFGNAAYFGAYPPARYNYYPVAARPVYVARPVVYGGFTPAYAPRPAVRAPLNRAYRRAWRRGW